MKTAVELKAEIIGLAREYSALTHRANRPGYEKTADERAFVSGETNIPYAGRVFTEDEVGAAVSATLDFWLTLGKEGESFEEELAQFLGVKRSILVNSGSSANLVAFSALTSHKLGERRIRPGDEVITCAAGFSTTVAPIVQNNAAPVFLDSDPLSLNARLDCLEEAFVRGKTKAVMMAHTLGNPFDLETIVNFCRRHELWLIEDNCDALGATYTLSPPQPLNPSTPQPLKLPPASPAHLEISPLSHSIRRITSRSTKGAPLTSSAKCCSRCWSRASAIRAAIAGAPAARTTLVTNVFNGSSVSSRLDTITNTFMRISVTT
jgi:hypothetical protein